MSSVPGGAPTFGLGPHPTVSRGTSTSLPRKCLLADKEPERPSPQVDSSSGSLKCLVLTGVGRESFLVPEYGPRCHTPQSRDRPKPPPLSPALSCRCTGQQRVRDVPTRTSHRSPTVERIHPRSPPRVSSHSDELHPLPPRPLVVLPCTSPPPRLVRPTPPPSATAVGGTRWSVHSGDPLHKSSVNLQTYTGTYLQDTLPST